MAAVVKSISTCSVNLIAGLANIVAERDSVNDAAKSMPPVLPHELVKLRGREFANIIVQQKDRLSVRCSLQKLEHIERYVERLRVHTIENRL
jgi:7,8-dihydro-6-hydroxymethylpterin-pyrophosphokinase